eukprot:3167595-Pyramimonas_sp.AAC.1
MGLLDDLAKMMTARSHKSLKEVPLESIQNYAELSQELRAHSVQLTCKPWPIDRTDSTTETPTLEMSV